MRRFLFSALMLALVGGNTAQALNANEPGVEEISSAVSEVSTALLLTPEMFDVLVGPPTQENRFSRLTEVMVFFELDFSEYLTGTFKFQPNFPPFMLLGEVDDGNSTEIYQMDFINGKDPRLKVIPPNIKAYLGDLWPQLTHDCMFFRIRAKAPGKGFTGIRYAASAVFVCDAPPDPASPDVHRFYMKRVPAPSGDLPKWTGK